MVARGAFAATFLCIVGLTTGAVNESTSYKYNVSPDSFESGTRISYCSSQNTVCATLCPKGYAPGSPYCNIDTLVWDCQCANAPTPNITLFDGTIPFYECQEYVAQCQTANTQNRTAQQQCLRIQCGGMNATQYAKEKYGSTTTRTMSSPTPKPSTGKSGGGTSNGNSGSSSGNGKSGGGNGNSNDNGNSGAVGLELGQSYGLAVFVGTAMLFFGFGLGL